MKPNYPALLELIADRFEGNQSKFAKAIGVERSHINHIIRKNEGAGRAFLSGIISYCESEGLDFHKYLS